MPNIDILSIVWRILEKNDFPICFITINYLAIFNLSFDKRKGDISFNFLCVSDFKKGFKMHLIDFALHMVEE